MAKKIVKVFKDCPVRIMDRDGEPWFIAKDVCTVLGLNNVGQALITLRENEKSSITINDGTPGTPCKAESNTRSSAQSRTLARSQLSSGAA